MFLYCHQLDAIISILDDARQHILLELCITAHFLCILSHAYMCFVDQKWIFRWLESFLLPDILMLWSPHLCREHLGDIILHDASAPCWNTLSLSSFPVYGHLIKLPMLHCLGWKLQFPVVRIFYSLGSKFLFFLPTVEISYEINLCSIWSPLTKHPPTFIVSVKSVIFMTVGKL